MTASEEHHIETPRDDEPSDRRLLASMVGWVGAILIFVLILYIAYVPNRTGPVDSQVTERRAIILEDVRMREVSLLQGYSRSATGDIRIPVSRAIEVIPQVLNQIPVQAAGQAAQAEQPQQQP